MDVLEGRVKGIAEDLAAAPIHLVLQLLEQVEQHHILLRQVKWQSRHISRRALRVKSELQRHGQGRAVQSLVAKQLTEED